MKRTRSDAAAWKTDVVSDLGDLSKRYRAFSRERDWEQFHDPRSLILALVGEVGELAELFQWPSKSANDALDPQSTLHRRSSEEIADVLLYLLRLADVLGIDLIDAANSKLDAAEIRFPADAYRGRAPDKSQQQ